MPPLSHFLWFFISITTLFACPPGEGPKPFVDITHNFKTDLTFLDTPDSVLDFLFWKRSKNLIFRNEFGQIMNYQDKNPFAFSNHPLAKLNDYNERYLATANSTKIFDTSVKQKWDSYKLPSNLVQHLFWERDFLYSIGKDRDEKGKSVLHFFRYHARTHRLRQICRDINFNNLKLASGHDYPYVYFYNEQQNQEERILTIYTAQLGRWCKLRPLKYYRRTVSGPIKSVHVFANQSAYAIEIDNPEKNLLWDSKAGGCNYFNTQGDSTLVPSYSVPNLLIFSPKRGLHLVLPETAQIADLSSRFLYPSALQSLNQTDISFDPAEKQIFLAPRFTHDNKKWLMKIAFQKLN